MKTAREVLERAMHLCGMTDSAGAIDRERDADMIRRGLPLTEQMVCDLYLLEHPDADPPEIKSSDTVIPLSARTVNDILPYGVAMLLAQVNGDAGAQSAFAAIYNQKRQSARRRTAAVTDVLPTGEWG